MFDLGAREGDGPPVCRRSLFETLCATASRGAVSDGSIRASRWVIGGRTGTQGGAVLAQSETQPLIQGDEPANLTISMSSTPVGESHGFNRKRVSGDQSQVSCYWGRLTAVAITAAMAAEDTVLRSLGCLLYAA